MNSKTNSKRLSKDDNVTQGASSDIYSKEKRSEVMSHVRSKDTKPELFVRSLLHKMGYRFRLHRKDLPGKPDIVLPKHKVVIFVHGCFWHQHQGCKKSTLPKDNAEFWKRKLSSNILRDLEVKKKLKQLGWKVLTVWECKTKSAADELISDLTCQLREPRI